MESQCPKSVQQLAVVAASPVGYEDLIRAEHTVGRARIVADLLFEYIEERITDQAIRGAVNMVSELLADIDGDLNQATTKMRRAAEAAGGAPVSALKPKRGPRTRRGRAQRGSGAIRAVPVAEMDPVKGVLVEEQNA